MQLRAKIFTLTVLVALAVPVLSVLLYNIYIDPFQIFHKDFQQPTVILGGLGTDRYQQSGIINQYDIESAIIGHSHSANYLPSKLEEELGWSKVYSLTMDGAPLYEQSMVAKRVLSKHAVDKVLWGFSVNNLMTPWNTINKKLPLKQFLYDNNWFNDLRFFLSLDLQKYATRKQNRKKHIRSANNSLELQNKEFDEATAWYSRNLCHFNRPAFVADKILEKKHLKYDEATDKILILQPQQEPLTVPPGLNNRIIYYKDNLYYNLLPIIVQNPRTEFNFVLTALPTLRMQRMKIFKKNEYETYQPFPI